MLDFQADGRMGAKARSCGAEALAMLYTLHRDNPLEFEAAVKLHGKQALYEFLTATSLPGGTDAWIDWLLAWVLKLTADVTQKRVH
jgi:hypothetical protein